LLFERFLSAGRDGPPDIDLDIEHRRREEAIQYVCRGPPASAITWSAAHAAQSSSSAAALGYGCWLIASLALAGNLPAMERTPQGIPISIRRRVPRRMAALAC